jgi:phosphoglycolate phosphatase
MMMLFIFDWDGTLCNSTGKIVRSMQLASHKLDMPRLEDAQVLNIIGLGLPEAVNQLYPQATQLEAQKLCETYAHFFLHDDSVGMALFEGVEETLHYLRDEGYRLTIATGKSRRGLERVLSDLKLKDFFHGSRCADETSSKPNPQMLLEILTEFRQSPEEAVMVGDTEYDMEMARRLEMPKIAVSYGAHTIDRLMPYRPILCVDRFAEIRNILPV